MSLRDFFFRRLRRTQRMRKIRTTMGAVVIQLEAEKKKKERLPIIDAKFTEDHFPLHPNDQA